MIIYDQEKDDGIDVQALTSSCISYASHVEPCNQDFVIQSLKTDKAIANIKDRDLYYVQSILVTSNWNKNDDVFDSAEIWKAKDTPEDKPTNLEHDENVIIGHITSNQPITDDGKPIDPETSADDLPEKFHILTGSVIYLGFTQDDLKERATKLVAEIENGTKYVSMECFFNDFDYGLIDKSTGDYKVLGRDNDSAYLTKYLKAYGGKGEYENYRVGRVLRNITFSGKGFVDKPANDNSIIFTKSMLDSFAAEKNTVSAEKGVVDNNLISTKSEKLIMSQETSVESLEKKFDSFVESQAKASDLQKQVEALQAEAEKHEEEEKARVMEQAKKEEEEEKAKKEAEATEEEEARMLEELKGELAKVTEELNAMKEEKLKAEEAAALEARMTQLADAGVAEEDTEALLALSDEQFSQVVALIKSYAKPEEEEAKKHDEEDKEEAEEDAEAEMPPALKEALEKKKKEEKADKHDDEDKAEESVADAEILEQVEVDDDVNLAVSEDSAEAELQSTRAALIDFVKSRLQVTN